MEDGKIIDLYWARSQQAIAESEKKYGLYCHTIAQRILERREDAEECVNDTWHRAWNAMPPQRPGCLRAFFAALTRNLSLDRWRERRAEKRGGGLEVLLSELEDCLPAAGGVEEEVEAGELAWAIDRWLDGLDRPDRTAFLRRYWYGQRVDQVARQAGCSPNTMTKRLGRLRDSLRRALEQEEISV